MLYQLSYFRLWGANVQQGAVTHQIATHYLENIPLHTCQFHLPLTISLTNVGTMLHRLKLKLSTARVA